MKVTVIGCGHVGLVTAACLAAVGHRVWAVDLSADRIAALQRGELTIQEPGLAELVAQNAGAGRLRFTTGHEEGLRDTDLVMIAVGTPPLEDGSADLGDVLKAARALGQHLSAFAVVAIKSTVPVGTADRLDAAIRQALKERGADVPFDVVSNPEFLKEGTAVADFQQPDRVIVGTDAPRAIALMRQLYAPFLARQAEMIVMDRRSAELSKYAANAMLAARISFMNEMATLAGALGADIQAVRRGIGADPRIGPLALQPGAGFGGPCLPKDLRALSHMAGEAGVPCDMLPAIMRVNERQEQLLFQRIRDYFGGDLSNRRVAVWGLAFKPGTDDVSEAPALRLIEDLVRAGAGVCAYDPQAMPNARRALAASLGPRLAQAVDFAPDALSAAEGADVLALMTEWQEFHEPDFTWLAARLRGRAVFDGRNLYEPQVLKTHGLACFGIGRS